MRVTDPFAANIVNNNLNIKTIKDYTVRAKFQ